MTTTLSPLPVQGFRDNNGNPLAGGLLYTYAAGTTTPLATYTDSTGVTSNTNPVVLNARGEAQVWIPPNVAYKYALTDSLGNAIWTVDQIVNSQLVTLYGGVDTGTVNAYVLNFTANFTSYTDGIVVYWVPSNTNTSASTININGLGVINVVNPGGAILEPGQIASGAIATIMILGGQAVLLTTTPVTGSAALTVTGVTGVSTISCPYSIANNNVVTLIIPAFAGVGAGTTFTLSTTNLIVAPPRTQPQWFMVPAAQDNGSNIYAQVGNVQTTGSPIPTGVLFTLCKNGGSGAWTATGARGIGDNTSVTGGYGIAISYPV